MASLEETQGLLSRFDSVYLGYITQGGAGGALAGCYEPTCQVLLFPYTPTASYYRGQRQSPRIFALSRTCEVGCAVAGHQINSGAGTNNDKHKLLLQDFVRDRSGVLTLFFNIPESRWPHGTGKHPRSIEKISTTPDPPPHINFASTARQPNDRCRLHVMSWKNPWLTSPNCFCTLACSDCPVTAFASCAVHCREKGRGDITI